MIVFACATKRSRIVDTKLNDIVLVNSSGQRCEVAEMINLISKDKPRAIGVNFSISRKRAMSVIPSLYEQLMNRTR